jgi:hypothetical protein
MWILQSDSKIENIPYNLIFKTKFNDSSILMMIISWDYLNLSLSNEYIGDVTIPNHVIKYNKCCSRWIRCLLTVNCPKPGYMVWLVQKLNIFLKFITEKKNNATQNDILSFWYDSLQKCHCLIKLNIHGYINSLTEENHLVVFLAFPLQILMRK